MLLLFIALAAFSFGEVVSLPVSSMATYSLDLDLDGVPEVERFLYDNQSGSLSFVGYLDALDAGTVFPDEPFYGSGGGVFSSLAALAASPKWCGAFLAPSVINRFENNVPGYGIITASEPVWAYWSYGTSGFGTQNVHLQAVVVDATAYFTSGRTADLKIYYHDYGSFAAGEGLNPAILAGTGVPVLASTRLAAEFEFLGPKSGTIKVASTAGRIYRLMRGTELRVGVMVSTAAGTGAELTLSWDDSASTDPRAFFWVEESFQ
jgi:hypothetical protein